MKESSGLDFFNVGLWTIPDAGNPEILYAIDTYTAGLLMSLTVPGVSNTDWEDLAQDKDYLYIGDFGNNSGNRKDLHILKVSKAGFPSGIAAPEIINFTFSDQKAFNHNQNAHNFDCEAFIYFNDSLHLFSRCP